MWDTGTLPIHFCLSNQDQATLEQVQGSPRVAEELHRKTKHWSSWSSGWAITCLPRLYLFPWPYSQKKEIYCWGVHKIQNFAFFSLLKVFGEYMANLEKKFWAGSRVQCMSDVYIIYIVTSFPPSLYKLYPLPATSKHKLPCLSTEKHRAPREILI